MLVTVRVHVKFIVQVCSIYTFISCELCCKKSVFPYIKKEGTVQKLCCFLWYLESTLNLEFLGYISGLKLILDFIPNHTGKKHEWFNKSQSNEEVYKDYYIWADGTGADMKSLPNNWVSFISKDVDFISYSYNS